MGLRHAIRAEYIKAISLQGVWIGLACSAIPIATFALLLAQLNDPSMGPVNHAELMDLVFQHFTLGGIPCLVIGALVAGTEYTRTDDTRGGANGWTITTLANPNRSQVLVAKLALLIPLCLVSYGLTLCGVTAYTQANTGINLFALLMGEPGRLVGAGVWLTALAIFGFSAVMIVGSVPIPLTLLIMNLSAVSPAALFAKTGYWVRFFPDLSAGGLLFPEATSTNNLLTEATRTSLVMNPVLNWTVIAVWVAGALALAWLRVRRTEVAA